MKNLKDYLPDGIKKFLVCARGWVLTLGLPRYTEFEVSSEELGASSKMSIVVPVHDAFEVTQRCLSSLERFGGKAEIIIIDDCSKLDSVKELLDDVCSRNKWKLIRHEIAQGHSRACEVGVSNSTRPLICLLNSDAVVTANCWKGIADAFDASTDIAIVGPMTSYTVGPQEIERASKCRHYWSDEQIWSFAKHYVSSSSESNIVEADFVGGFAFFIRSSVWDELDGFDSNLPDYGNEIEICKRTLKYGYKIVYTDSSYIHHFGKQSYGVSLGMSKISALRIKARDYINNKHKEAIG